MKSNHEKLIVLFCIKSHTNLSRKIEYEKLLIRYLNTADPFEDEE